MAQKKSFGKTLFSPGNSGNTGNGLDNQLLTLFFCDQPVTTVTKPPGSVGDILVTVVTLWSHFGNGLMV
jgi:hypothetical protein